MNFQEFFTDVMGRVLPDGDSARLNERHKNWVKDCLIELQRRSPLKQIGHSEVFDFDETEEECFATRVTMPVGILTEVKVEDIDDECDYTLARQVTEGVFRGAQLNAELCECAQTEETAVSTPIFTITEQPVVTTPVFIVSLVDQVSTPTFVVTVTPVTSPVQFSPGDGTSFIGTQLVTLTTATPGPYEIRYTIDGSAPNAGSLLYSVPLNLAATTRVRAIAVKTGYTTGAETEATYTLSVPVLPNVVISPATERFFDDVTVSLSCADGAALIYYTTNGSTPTEASTLYTVPFTITQDPLDPPVITTVKAKAFRTFYTASATASQAYNPVIPIEVYVARTAPASVFWYDLVGEPALTVNVGASTNLYMVAYGSDSVFNVIYDGVSLFPPINLSGSYSGNITLSGAASEVKLSVDLPMNTYSGYFDSGASFEEVTIKIYAY